ncbi:M10 family metallopeptidase C-terminal domain-containing protein [Sphingomonas sp. GCM10030256]|uniref:M10 family metallopeptidase C-terminal domain-containing protein n=1 Tax=Sphingomonas sp. GCM10030256 TaxID=3273427 RepID=UPI00361EF802
MPRPAANAKGNTHGSKGNDGIIGSPGKDVINGRGGDDTINGLEGNDTLRGGSGNDILIGGVGSDRLAGGRGSDTFRYLTLAESNASSGIDLISDFDPSEDTIDLSALGGIIWVASYQSGMTSVLQAVLTQDGPNRSTISIYNGSSEPAFEAKVAGHLSSPTGIVGVFSPLLVTFEDVVDEPTGTEDPVPNGYYGFDWVVPDTLDVGDDTLFVLIESRASIAGTGYQLGSIDPGEWVAYTPNGSQPVTITRSDGSDFIFDQVYLTAAWDELQAVTLTGYNDGEVVGTFSGTINNDEPTLIDVDWSAIDTLVINNSTLIGDGGTFPRPNLVLDNFLFYV